MKSTNSILLGYERVSKNDGSQVLDLQRDALIDGGVDEDRIYSDKQTGRHDDRPGLQNCLKALQPGNTLVVWKLDRLGRSLRDLIKIVDNLQKRGIHLKVLSGMGMSIDTSSPTGKLCFAFFSALAEFESDLISERTKAGLNAARARGRKGGRPRKMDKQSIKMAMTAMSDRTTIASDVAKRLGITPTTLYYYVNGDGSPKEPAVKILKGSISN